MNTTQDFLTNLKNLDIKLWLEADNLRCNAPKGVLTPDIRSELAARKAEIIAKLQQQDQELPIHPTPRTATLPLSFGQARLWFVEQLDGGTSTAYNLPNAYELFGYLDVPALERAIAEIIRRHEVLRTNFHAFMPEPVQVIHPLATVTLPVVDLQELAADEQADLVQRLVQEDACKPFNLAHDLLIRTTLLRLTPKSHVLLLNIHHIVFDGWSMGCLIQELSTLYGVYRQGLPSPLPELAIQYVDFAVWQRQRLSGERLQTELNYWKQQLAGIPPRLELPIERTRQLGQTFEGASVPLTLTPELTQEIRQLSRQLGVTPYMTLLTAFAILLARYTGQEDIVIGSPIANRHRPEVKSLIGFFVNTVVLRVDLSCNPTFSELLGRVRRMTLDAYEHQEVPFEKVVEALRPERHLNYSPLFQVMFDWQNALTAQWELPGLVVAHIPTTPVVGKFDLSLTIGETETMLEGRWEYNSHQFENEAIARMSEHFQTLLLSIVSHPSRPVRELPLLTASAHQLLAAWNSTQIDYPSTKCIHHLFEEQVQKTPDAVAVEMEDQQITYQELNERASQLAHHLQTLGVRPEVLVGICVERSIHMVIGLLGILKAGSAYVPLDPRLPQERLAYILQDTQVPILLTQQKLVSNLPEHGQHLVCLDTDWQVIGNLSRENPVSGADAHNLAYVIYTSGSTGSPKGVAIAHQSLVNFTSMAVQEYGINEQDRILQFASISFDTAAEEIYPCLTAGGTLVLRTDEMLSSSNQFWQQCRDWQLTVLDLPTAYWHHLTSLLTASDKRIPETLRLVIIGGERAYSENVRKWLLSVAFLPNPPTLLNTYGPTEATVVTTLYQLPESTLSDTLEEVPIGRPMGNAQVYVLDQYLQSVPIGVPGELHIGGAGVARGYLNRPDLTKEKFIPNPFLKSDEFKVMSYELEENSSIQNSKLRTQNPKLSCLYKTGDLVRYRPDGHLEFLGRIDNQVKIRGFRIELLEIEAAIAQHPQVRATAVIAQEDKLGNKRLVAYIVFVDMATSSELRSFLQQKLPDYMIPTAWVKLDTIPLTNNGKVDYGALRARSQEISRDVRFVPPRDELEQQLTQIWSEVLDVHPVGVLDNFFELGGHSLLAFSLMARVQQQFGKTLPLTSIFQGATVEQFAAILRQKNSYTGSLVKIQPNGSKPPLFLIHPGGASLLAYEDLISCMDTEQPLYGLDAKGFEEGQKPQDQVEEMAINYIEAIQTVQPEGPYLLAGWCFGGLVAFEMAQRLLCLGQQVSELALIDTYIRSSGEPLDDIDLLYGLFFELFGVSFPVEKLRQMAPDERLIYTFEQAKQANRLPPNFGLDRIKRLFEVGKSHDRASVNYTPQPYPGVVTLIRASEGISATLSNPALGWETLADKVDLHWVCGDHISMFHQPHVQGLAEKLQFCIQRQQLSHN